MSLAHAGVPSLVQSPEDRQALIVEGAGRLVAALLSGDVSKKGGARRGVALVSYLPLDRQGLFKERCCPPVVALTPRQLPQILQRQGDRELVPDLPPQRQSFLLKGARHPDVALSVGQTR